MLDKNFKFISFLHSLDNEYASNLIESVKEGFLAIYESVTFPDGFVIEDLKAIPSFSGRIKYVNERLKKLGKGSSRIVYYIDDSTVLKLAMNDKGIAQNDTEGDWGLHNMYDTIIPELIDKDDDDLWIVVKYARNVNQSRFKELFGRSFKDFCAAIRYDIDTRITNSRGIKWSKPDYMEEMYENDFFTDIVDMAINFDMPTGDICRIGSYGEIDGKLVLRDPGLTKDTFNEHYKK